MLQAKSVYEVALAFTLTWEGGYSNDPADLGGETNFGITQSTYNAYRAKLGQSSRSVKEIAEAEMKDIYRRQYWGTAQCGRMAPPLAVAMFDTAVNFGVGGAIEFLQEVLGLVVDGDWGAKAEAAFLKNNGIATALKLCDARISYRNQRVSQDQSQSRFLEGWLNRDTALKVMISQQFGGGAAVITGGALSQPTRPTEVRQGAHDSINWRNWQAQVSEYFTVGEVCQWDQRRIPSDPQVMQSILKIARELDQIRKAWGHPLGVTSWYRPPAINREVGGVANSQHLYGLAVDVYPVGGDIFAFQDWIDQRWSGCLGWGAAKGFVHLDIRDGGGFVAEGAADKGVRWTY